MDGMAEARRAQSLDLAEGLKRDCLEEGLLEEFACYLAIFCYSVTYRIPLAGPMIQNFYFFAADVQTNEFNFNESRYAFHALQHALHSFLKFRSGLCQMRTHVSCTRGPSRGRSCQACTAMEGGATSFGGVANFILTCIGNANTPDDITQELVDRAEGWNDLPGCAVEAGAPEAQDADLWKVAQRRFESVDAFMRACILNPDSPAHIDVNLSQLLQSASEMPVIAVHHPVSLTSRVGSN